MASPYSFILKPRKGPQSNEPFIYKTCEVFYFFFFMSLSGESSLIYSRCSLKRVEKGEMMGKKKKTVKSQSQINFFFKWLQGLREF